jgi:hypothetical protein
MKRTVLKRKFYGEILTTSVSIADFSASISSIVAALTIPFLRIIKKEITIKKTNEVVQTKLKKQIVVER